MTLYMETTKISPEKTSFEIAALLAKAGASAIQTEYKDKKVVAMSFMIEVDNINVPYRLPIRTESLFIYFQNKHNSWDLSNYADKDREKAERVGWRQILRWIQAQLALVDTGMVKAAEVFLPYLQTGIDETLYQRIEASGFKALPAPEDI